MQNLHLVGFTTDRRHLIFSARQGAKSGGYLVPVDDELLAAVDDLAHDPARAEAEGEEPDEPAEAPSPPVESRLSVREVQARLRAGASVEDVADDAGVDVDWVERFAPPIRAEQRQVVDLARDLPLMHSRAGASAKPLGLAVAASMAERGVTLTDEGFDRSWTARLIGRDHWIIEFSFEQRGRRRSVAWTLDLVERHLTTSDRTASQIGFVEPTEPRSTTSTAGPRAPSSSNDGVASETPAGERSTRGDGRPDGVNSTWEARRARTASELAATKKMAATKNATAKKSMSTSAPRKKAPAEKASTSRSTAASKPPAEETPPASTAISDPTSPAAAPASVDPAPRASPAASPADAVAGESSPAAATTGAEPVTEPAPVAAPPVFVAGAPVDDVADELDRPASVQGRKMSASTTQFRRGEAVRAADSAPRTTRGPVERPRASLTVTTKRSRRDADREAASNAGSDSGSDVRGAAQPRSGQSDDTPTSANGRRVRTRPLRAR
ncbi:MAG: septation protein SepH [Acidimicrobiales bacterium]|nr:septation protein SepH [Acidimicrobiales bacterium]